MLPKAERAYFAIADLSGYTDVLASVELDHAQDIIADFIGHGLRRRRDGPFRRRHDEGDRRPSIDDGRR
jgi:hypothetical protein